MEQKTKVVTGTVRLSYAHIFEPQVNEDGSEKYSVSLLIPKTDTETINKIKKAVNEAKEIGKTSKWSNKIPSNCKLPLRDGDVEREDDEVYKNHYFVTATSKTKPDIRIYKGKKADGKPILEETDNSTEVYSGCYARDSVNFYPFDAKGNKGVACGLNSIVKVMDGEALGGRSSADEDFADTDFSDVDLGLDDDELL